MDVGWEPSAAKGFAGEADTASYPELFLGLICTGGGVTGSWIQAHLPRQAPENLT